MRIKEILKELSNCDQLKCQGCKFNIKVLHSFDCAAHIFDINAWKERLTNVLNEKYNKDKAFLEAIDLHEKNKLDCNLCPLYDMYHKCALKRFQDRQTILRTMRKENGMDETEDISGKSSRTDLLK